MTAFMRAKCARFRSPNHTSSRVAKRNSGRSNLARFPHSPRVRTIARPLRYARCGSRLSDDDTRSEPAFPRDRVGFVVQKIAPSFRRMRRDVRAREHLGRERRRHSLQIRGQRDKQQVDDGRRDRHGRIEAVLLRHRAMATRNGRR